MKRLRTFTVAMSACFIAAVAPSPALASPLLSGYGGPGQGNQAILGSALLGGPGEGSGGGSGGGSGSASGARGSQESTTQTSSAPESAGSGGSAGSPRPHRSAHKARGASKPAPGANTPRPFTSTADVGSETLGLSGTDMLYLLLGLALLVMTAVATRMLGRRAP